jgi:hypothetical protein
MPTPQEIESAAGIDLHDEVDRRRVWAAAQALASGDSRAPSAGDLRTARQVLDAADAATREHLSEGLGRATITLTDTGEADGEFEVAVECVPQLEEDGDEIAGTPAQIIALELLESTLGPPEGDDEHGHDHHH